MKKIKIIGLIIIALVVNACEQDFEDERFRPRDRTSGWVEFPSASETVFTSNGDFTVPIDVNVPINDDGFNVNYTVEVISGSAPSVDTGTFDANVSADTRNPNISLSVDPENISQYSIKVTLNSVDQGNITAGIPNSGRLTEFVLDVTCPTPLEYNATSFIGSTPIENFTVTLTPIDGSPNEYEISSAWGEFVAEATGNPAFLGAFQYTGTLIVNDDNSVEIIPDDSSISSEGGTGTIDVCADKLNYTLTQDIFGSDFVVDVELEAVE